MGGVREGLVIGLRRRKKGGVGEMKLARFFSNSSKFWGVIVSGCEEDGCMDGLMGGDKTG